MARPHAGPAAAKEVPPGSATTLVEFTVQEVEQNRRVISSVKKLQENSGEPGKTRSISALRVKDCDGKNEIDAACYKGKQELNVASKGREDCSYAVRCITPGWKARCRVDTLDRWL